MRRTKRQRPPAEAGADHLQRPSVRPRRARGSVAAVAAATSTGEVLSRSLTLVARKSASLTPADAMTALCSDTNMLAAALIAWRRLGQSIAKDMVQRMYKPTTSPNAAVHVEIADGWAKDALAFQFSSPSGHSPLMGGATPSSLNSGKGPSTSGSAGRGGTSTSAGLGDTSMLSAFAGSEALFVDWPDDVPLVLQEANLEGIVKPPDVTTALGQLGTQPHTRWFRCLNNALLVQVLGWLDRRSLLTASATSRRWRHAGLDVSLWSSLQTTSAAIVALRAPAVKSLTLCPSQGWSGSVSRTSIDAIRQLPRLQVERLNVIASDACAASIAALLRAQPKLVHITLSECKHVDDSCLIALSTAHTVADVAAPAVVVGAPASRANGGNSRSFGFGFGVTAAVVDSGSGAPVLDFTPPAGTLNTTSLRTLCLRGCALISDVGMAGLTLDARLVTALETVDCTRCFGVSSSGLCSLLEAIRVTSSPSQPPRLRVLRVSGVQGVDDHLLHTIASFAGPTLQHLELGRLAVASTRKAKTNALAAGLSQDDFELPAPRMDFADIRALPHAQAHRRRKRATQRPTQRPTQRAPAGATTGVVGSVATAPSATTAVRATCAAGAGVSNDIGITDVGVLKLAAVCHSISRIDFAGNPGVTDASAIAFIRANPGLCDLGLRQCSITDVTVQAAASLQHLKELELYGTQTSDAGLAALAQFKPPLRHLDLSGCARITPGALASLLRVVSSTLESVSLGDLPLVTPVQHEALLQSCAPGAALHWW